MTKGLEPRRWSLKWRTLKLEEKTFYLFIILIENSNDISNLLNDMYFMDFVTHVHDNWQW